MSVGKATTKWIVQGIEEYEKRLRRYIKFTSKSVPDIKKGSSIDQTRQKEEEGKSLLGEITDSDYVVLLDEKGKEFTSVSFSRQLEKLMSSGRKRLVFVVGGPYGFSEKVYERSDALISLSQMTFTHEMVRLFFTEQVYRGMTIIRGEPYHHV